MGAVAVVVAVTFVGSEGLVWFDPALVGYLFGTIFAVFGVVYRYTVWLRRPPTAMLNRRGWEVFRARWARNLAALPSLVVSQLLAQGFIRRRSRSRWLAHQLVFWGCLLAAAVTFPLALGLLHFESVGQDADRYEAPPPTAWPTPSSSTRSTGSPRSPSPSPSPPGPPPPPASSTTPPTS
jgi:hypothetical protein